MDTDDLSWYRGRFIVLKSLFGPGPAPDLVPLSPILFQRKRTALGEAEVRLKAAALGYLAAMQEKVAGLGPEGKALHDEIAAFVAVQWTLVPDRDRTISFSGRTLDDWLRERRRQNPIAPATLRDEDDPPGDKGGQGGLPPFIPPDMRGF